MRRLLAISILVLATGTVEGCRCQSGLGGENAFSPGSAVSAGGTEAGTEAGTGQARAQSTVRWCRACAKGGFMACKRVDGPEPDDVLRRKAELSACADVGFSEADCTSDKLSMVTCGAPE